VVFTEVSLNRRRRTGEGCSRKKGKGKAPGVGGVAGPFEERVNSDGKNVIRRKWKKRKENWQRT